MFISSRLKPFIKDEQAGVMVFSAMMMMVLILFVAHTINVSDLTTEKIRVQDAADATAYSGAQVRANLYNAMGFLNMAKAALYRLRYSNARNTISPGQVAILAEFAQMIPGFDYGGNPLDKETWVGMSLHRIITLAELADQAQLAIDTDFQDIITQEMDRIAATHHIDDLKLKMGQEPSFYRIWAPTYEELHPPPDYTLRLDYDSYIWAWYPDFYGFCQHVVELQHWIEPEPMGCPIDDPYQSWMDYEFIAVGPSLMNLLALGPLPQMPLPIIIGHTPSSTENTLKAAVWKETKSSVLFPALFSNPSGGIWGYASAGAFAGRIGLLNSYYNLYVTDFVAKLVSLNESAFFEYMGPELPEIPSLPEEFYVH